MAGSVPETWTTRRGAAVFYGPRVMGILNVTPDSFSDGGRHEGVSAALALALTAKCDFNTSPNLNFLFMKWR